MGISSYPTARGYTKLEECFGEIGNVYLEVLDDQSYFGNVMDVKKVSTQNQDSGRKKINDIGSDVKHLGGMFTGFLIKSVRVFTSQEIISNKEILRDLEEIGGMNY